MVGEAAEDRTTLHLLTVLLLSLCTWALVAMPSWAVERRPGALPYASDAHRAGPAGYGGLKARRAPLPNAGDVRNNDKKQPYDYRYYSDTDRSPGSCRRYASRAIATRNANWWTRYRACRNN
jgi:hypothetical protein